MIDTGPGPLDRDAILAFLAEVDAELVASEPAGARHTLVIAGGAVMAILGLRGATHDIDSVIRLDEPIRAAAQRVAARAGQPKTVLNDAGSAWRPATLNIGECPIVLAGGKLTVRQVPIDLMFVMKLDASRVGTMDAYDLAQLAPLVSFVSAQEVQAAHEAAYPNTPDPRIGEWAWNRYVAPAQLA